MIGTAGAKEEVLDMLAAEGPTQQALFERARRLRREHFDDRVVVRGVIEITNLCRVNCSYCPMRRDNTRDNNTFRLGIDEIMGAAKEIQACGIGVVFFQAGEVPQTTTLLAEVIPRVKDLFNGDVEVLLNIGIKSHNEYELLRRKGADSAILKYETSDVGLHLHHREEALERRLECIRTLQSLGYRVGSGTIVGLPGQTREILADDVLLSRDLNLDMSSSSPFLPAPGTPLAEAPPGDLPTSLNTMAAMRVLLPGALIPSVSALERLRPGGQLMGLNAGGNVLTINFTPQSRTADYLIYGKNRYLVRIDHVRRLLDEAGLSHPLNGG